MENEKKVERRNAIVAFLKQLIAPLIFCVLVAVAVVVIMLYKKPEEEEEVIETKNYLSEQEEYVMENDRFLFKMEGDTTSFTVTDKETGKVWYATPEGVDNDTKALLSEKENLKSTMMIVYSTTEGIKTTYNNYTYSISRGIYEINQNDDCIRVNYTIGDTQKVFIMPIAVPESRMNEFLDLMEDSKKKKVKEYFRKINIKKLRATDNKEELLAKYPDLETENVYVLRDGIAEYLKATIEEYFTEVGYTYEDYEADLARYNTSMAEDIPLFNIAIEYRLNETGLEVEVPLDSIEYKQKYPMVSVKVLPYFGAGTLEDEGYMFVPEGGGGIIDYNNGRTSQNSYYTQIYGWDFAQTREAVVTDKNSVFPVFGMCNNENSFICVLEDGASYAGIEADVSGRYHNYNYVCADYTTLHSEAYDVSEKSNAAVYVYEKKIPEGKLSQRYIFVDSKDYSDMALAYQDYLLDTKDNMTRTKEAEVPVGIELVGAIDKTQQKFGFPVSCPLPLTTYEEAEWVLEDLKQRGFSNMSVKYTGWMNGGQRQQILNDVDLVSKLGSKKKFDDFVKYASDNDIDLYLDGTVQYAYHSNLLDGFIAFRDAARFTTREKAELYTYTIVWYGQEEWNETYYLLKPENAALNTKVFTEAVSKYGACGVAFRDTGNQLSADYNPKDLVTREESRLMQEDSLKEVRDADLKVMTNGGNDYSIGLTDFMMYVDYVGYECAIINRTVPFYQIALHGYVNFSGTPVNLSGDYEKLILCSAETASALSFNFMKEDSLTLQDTLYTRYFGSDYDRWIDRAEAIYTDYNQKIAPLYNQTIQNHYSVGKNVNVTVFEDGSKVYVNYTDDEVTAEDVVIPAKSYVVKGE